MKDLSLETEYCVYMVAIMMVHTFMDPLVNSVFEWAANVAENLR